MNNNQKTQALLDSGLTLENGIFTGYGIEISDFDLDLLSDNEFGTFLDSIEIAKIQFSAEINKNKAINLDDKLQENTDLATDLLNSAIEGEISALDVANYFNEMAKMYDDFRKAVMSFAISEFKMFGKKEVEYKNFKVSETAGATYDYKHSVIWQNKKAELKAIEDKMKAVLNYFDKGQNVPPELSEFEPAIKNYSTPSLSFKRLK